MRLQTFIDRPILSGVVSVMIFVAGLIALAALPVEQYPDIAPPTVKVSAQYSGANADAVEKAVVVPLEEAINGVENMTYMTSTASNTGNAEITVFFKQGTDPDMAAVNVQNKVQTATSLLPAEVTKVGVKTTKSQTSTLKIFGLCSPNGTYDKNFLTNYLSINIKPQIQRIQGVGEVSVMGGDYAMRIWLKPDVMAMYGLQPKDVESALSSQNVEASTGAIGEDSKNVYQYALKYRGRLEKDSEFENIVIKAFDDGRILRLKDIAKVELGAQRYNYTGGVNGAPGVSCMVYQIVGTNANEIITNIDNYLDQLKKDLPDDIEIVDLVNTKDFLSASINEVVKTLVEALLLVVLVVFAFLGSLRSTVIPAISVIVSLVGTFAAIYVAGFSMNLLTLFALVLAIGTIVDDAIIVVEAVQARLDSSYQSPYKATVDAIGGISSAVITSTIVFMAVFVPVAFMGGTAGVFYTQFGVTMAVAVGISAVNALTLAPALCALFLKTNNSSLHTPHSSLKIKTAFDAAFNRLLLKYKNVAKLFVKRRYLSWSLLGIASLLLCYFLATSQSSLVPQEDTGALYINLNSPAGSTLSQTEAIMAKIEKEIKEIPEVENYNVSVGKSIGTANGASYGMFVLKLKHWDERKGKEHSAEAVTKEIYRRTAHIKDARLIVFAPPMVSGYGSGGGVELYVQDRAGKGTDSLAKVTNRFIAALNERKEIQRAFTSFDNTFPQFTLDVDEVACQRAGITTSTVISALSGYIGSSYASNFNRFSKLYRVIVQAPSDYRSSVRSLDNIFVKTTAGMAPVSHFVTLRKTYGAETLTRFNLFSSVKVQGVPADGYSSGDAIRAIAEVAAQTLPKGYGYEYAGMTREEAKGVKNKEGRVKNLTPLQMNSSLFTLSFSLLFIYLILCALYESLLIPFSVILSVPFGLMGSMALARLCGIDNNIYLQTGLIMLIGLLSKTAILITEYAVARRKQGMSLAHAALSAAAVRFRPIVMTVLCMVIGMLPLVFASGVGANGNRSLGIGVVGGLVVGTIALLFVTPTFFIAFQWLEEKMRRRRA